MSKTLRELGVGAAIILFAAVIYRDSLSLGPGVYDPLGAGTMPRIVATGAIALTLVVIAQALLAAGRPGPAAPARDFALRPWLAVQIFCFMLACAALLYARVSFGLSSALFLFASILAIRRYALSAVPAAAIVACVFGFGLAYLFGDLFGVDLP